MVAAGAVLVVMLGSAGCTARLPPTLCTSSRGMNASMTRSLSCICCLSCLRLSSSSSRSDCCSPASSSSSRPWSSTLATSLASLRALASTSSCKDQIGWDGISLGHWQRRHSSALKSPPTERLSVRTRHPPGGWCGIQPTAALSQGRRSARAAASSSCPPRQPGAPGNLANWPTCRLPHSSCAAAAACSSSAMCRAAASSASRLARSSASLRATSASLRRVTSSSPPRASPCRGVQAAIVQNLGDRRQQQQQQQQANGAATPPGPAAPHPP
jgi:hypothetical protein